MEVEKVLEESTIKFPYSIGENSIEKLLKRISRDTGYQIHYIFEDHRKISSHLYPSISRVKEKLKITGSVLIPEVGHCWFYCDNRFSPYSRKFDSIIFNYINEKNQERILEMWNVARKSTEKFFSDNKKVQ